MISLPFPAKPLWPNGRTRNVRYRAALVRKAREEAAWAAKAARLRIGDSPIPVRIVVHPKAKGPLPDRDNCVSACKAYLDGIASAIGINDRHFAAPTVEFSPIRSGRFVIYVGDKGE